MYGWMNVVWECNLCKERARQARFGIIMSGSSGDGIGKGVIGAKKWGIHVMDVLLVGWLGLTCREYANEIKRRNGMEWRQREVVNATKEEEGDRQATATAMNE